MDGIIKRPGATSGTVRIGAVRAGAAASQVASRPSPVMGRPAQAGVSAAPSGAELPPGAAVGAPATSSRSAAAPAAFSAAAALAQPRPAVAAAQPLTTAPADRPTQVPPPAPELEALRATARAAGYQEGREEGRAAVEREFAALGQSLRERFEACLDALQAAHLRLQRDVEDACVDIAFAAVVQVLGRASADPSMVHQAVRQALRQAGALGGLRIRLHPQDAQSLAPLLADWVPDPADGRLPAPVICPDPSVGRGGCILSSEQGDIDARLETQLQHLAALLQRHREAAMASTGEPGTQGVPE